VSVDDLLKILELKYITFSLEYIRNRPAPLSVFHKKLYLLQDNKIHSDVWNFQVPFLLPAFRSRPFFKKVFIP
jgi:hypothetical protein